MMTLLYTSAFAVSVLLTLVAGKAVSMCMQELVYMIYSTKT